MRKVSYRKLHSVNVVSLNEDLATSELCQNPSDDLQELVSSYNNTLMAALDKHAPLMTRTIVQRPRVPWFSPDQEIREAKRQRRKAEKRWRKSRLESDLAAFKAKRNFTTRLMNKARREFYSKKEETIPCKSALINLTAQWMMVSDLIWTLELSLTTWGSTLFRR